ncbi:MAG TPA: hypothetical protein VIG74_01020 [Alphaproteobacteria bacterium]
MKLVEEFKKQVCDKSFVFGATKAAVVNAVVFAANAGGGSSLTRLALAMGAYFTTAYLGEKALGPKYNPTSSLKGFMVALIPFALLGHALSSSPENIPNKAQKPASAETEIFRDKVGAPAQDLGF